MATLPDMPVNTAVTVGSLAAMGLIGFITHTRAKLESQNLENYRVATSVAADLTAGTRPVNLRPEKSDRSA